MSVVTAEIIAKYNQTGPRFGMIVIDRDRCRVSVTGHLDQDLFIQEWEDGYMIRTKGEDKYELISLLPSESHSFRTGIELKDIMSLDPFTFKNLLMLSGQSEPKAKRIALDHFEKAFADANKVSLYAAYFYLKMCSRVINHPSGIQKIERTLSADSREKIATRLNTIGLDMSNAYFDMKDCIKSQLR